MLPACCLPPLLLPAVARCCLLLLVAACCRPLLLEACCRLLLPAAGCSLVLAAACCSSADSRWPRIGFRARRCTAISVCFWFGVPVRTANPPRGGIAKHRHVQNVIHVAFSEPPFSRGNRQNHRGNRQKCGDVPPNPGGTAKFFGNRQTKAPTLWGSAKPRQCFYIGNVDECSQVWCCCHWLVLPSWNCKV